MRLDGLLLDGDGPSLFLRQVSPDNPRGCLVLLHGSMVHSEYYLPIATSLAERGWAVVVPDLRGHGRSDGMRGHLPDFRRHVEDAARVAAWAADHAPRPLVMAGESYGGLVAFLATADGSVAADALVLAAPAFRLLARVPPRLIRLAKAAAQVVPGLRLPVTMRLVGVSSKPDLDRIAARDPLVCRQYTVGFFVEMLHAQDEAFAIAPRCLTPTLALLGGRDMVTDNAASQRVLARAGGPVRIIAYPEFLHAVLSEDMDRVADDVTGWLHSASQPVAATAGALVPTML